MKTDAEREQFLSFCDFIFDLRDKFDFSVTSWIRTPLHNKAVGGKETSKHLDGLGLDTVLDKPTDLSAYVEYIRGRGYVPVLESDHIHVQVK